MAVILERQQKYVCPLGLFWKQKRIWKCQVYKSRIASRGASTGNVLSRNQAWIIDSTQMRMFTSIVAWQWQNNFCAVIKSNWTCSVNSCSLPQRYFCQNFGEFSYRPLSGHWYIKLWWKKMYIYNLYIKLYFLISKKPKTFNILL